MVVLLLAQKELASILGVVTAWNLGRKVRRDLGLRLRVRKGANRPWSTRLVREGLLGHVGAGSGRLGRRNNELMRVDRRALVTIEGTDRVLTATEYLVVSLGGLVFQIFVKRSARITSAL